MTDAINPKHYQRPNGQQVKDAIKIIVHGLPPYEAYLVGSVVKYLSRYREKGDPIENLEKGGNFLRFAIEEVQDAIAADVAQQMDPESTDALSTLREIAAKLPASNAPVERREPVYFAPEPYHGMMKPK